MYKIMIIEDDLLIARTLKEHLETWDYQVDVVTDFRNIIEQFIHIDPQLVLLDIMLPYFNGFHWCSEIRIRKFDDVEFGRGTTPMGKLTE